MLKFTMKRLVYLVLVLVGVSFLVFLLLYMTPGDPVRMMLGESATPEAQAELRLELGLDDPFLVQYGRYIKNIVVHQDLGTSYSTRRPVLDEIMTVFPNTVHSGNHHRRHPGNLTGNCLCGQAELPSGQCRYGAGAHWNIGPHLLDRHPDDYSVLCQSGMAATFGFRKF